MRSSSRSSSRRLGSAPGRPVPRVLAAAVCMACLVGTARAQTAASVTPAPIPPLAGEALPKLSRVVSGQAATITSPTGRELTIRQTSEHAAIAWERFDIGRDVEVDFRQPSPTAVAVNRVLTRGASRIEGRLSANGQVFLLNEQGVLIGDRARVEVGGLVLSTAMQASGDGWADTTWVDLRDRVGVGAVQHSGRIELVKGGVALMQGGDVRIDGSIRGSGVALTVRGADVRVGPDSRVELDGRGVEHPGRIDMEARGSLEVAGPLLANGDKVSGGSIQLKGEHAQVGNLSASSKSRSGGSIVIRGDRGVIITSSLTAAGGIDGGRIEIIAARGTIVAEDMHASVAGGAAGGGFSATGARLVTRGGSINANGGAGGGTVTLTGTAPGVDAPMVLAGRMDISATAVHRGAGGRIHLSSTGAIRTDERVNLRVFGVDGAAGELTLLARAGSRPSAFLDFGSGRGGRLTLGAQDWAVEERPPLRGDQEAGNPPARVSAKELVDWLDRGLAVSLVATRKLAVNQRIETREADSGALTLAAGDLALNASIVRTAGDLSLKAGPSDPGSITAAPGADIEAPRSTVSFHLPPRNPHGEASGARELTLGVVKAAALKVDSRSVHLVGLRVDDKHFDGSTVAVVKKGWSLGKLKRLPGSNLSEGIEASFADARPGVDKPVAARFWLSGYDGDARAELPLNGVTRFVGDVDAPVDRGWETVATIHPLPTSPEVRPEVTPEVEPEVWPEVKPRVKREVRPEVAPDRRRPLTPLRPSTRRGSEANGSAAGCAVLEGEQRPPGRLCEPRAFDEQRGLAPAPMVQRRAPWSDEIGISPKADR